MLDTRRDKREREGSLSDGGTATNREARRSSATRRTGWHGRHARALTGVLLASALAVASLQARADPPNAPRLGDTQHFTIDPVVDGVLVGGGATFSLMLGLVLSTGELRPGLPGDPDKLLAIDRIAVTQTIDPKADLKSDVGLWIAHGYALLDPVLSGVRHGRRAALVDFILYAEAFALTEAFTSATKIGVRRPRPIDYAHCGMSVGEPPPRCSSTDVELSFFSGHASKTGALSATATYLAFVRSGPRSWRPWLTLVAGTTLTAFVSYERVRSGAHFPTDVIMGSLAGAGIGVLVPHFHRRPHYHDKVLEGPPELIGYAPLPNGGGSVTALWRF